MTDETIRTRAINSARRNPKVVIAYLVAAISMIWNAGNLLGHKQASNETLVTDVVTLKTDMQALKTSVADTNVSLARIEGTLNGINMKTEDLGRFKEDVQKGAKEALATPVPKGIPQGHRARKP